MLRNHEVAESVELIEPLLMSPFNMLATYRMISVAVGLQRFVGLYPLNYDDVSFFVLSCENLCLTGVGAGLPNILINEIT